MPFKPPFPKQQSDGFPLEFRLKGSQIKFRTLSENCTQAFLILLPFFNFPKLGDYERVLRLMGREVKRR